MDEQANIRRWLEAAEQKFGEQIEAIVVGPMGGWRRGEPAPHEDVILSREDGLAALDRDYDNGYGCADCSSAYAWTASRVFFVSEYDGATDLAYVPRNPAAGMPSFDGESF